MVDVKKIRKFSGVKTDFKNNLRKGIGVIIGIYWTGLDYMKNTEG